MTVSFVQPHVAYEASYVAYIRELGDAERYPFPLDFEHDDFPALLKRLEDCASGVNLPEGFVPSSTYWLIEDGEIVGVSNLRHYLNDRIREYGGHIGLGIRPSCQGRGLGTRLLALTIEAARRRGIGEIHVHCNKDNPASAGMIVANGGMLDSEIEHGDPVEVIQRYIIAAERGR